MSCSFLIKARAKGREYGLCKIRVVQVDWVQITLLLAFVPADRDLMSVLQFRVLLPQRWDFGTTSVLVSVGKYSDNFSACTSSILH